MFDFGNANDNQRDAISATEGPVLITAGPGTGKTFTLVQRAIYLIQECGVQPEQIMMATFTEKAAKELVTRITNELASRNIVVNVNDMYIGTFHSLCLRIIKEHLEFTRLKKNYRTLDAFDQNYTIFQKIDKFKKIENVNSIFTGGRWKMAKEICMYVNTLLEELVDEDDLKKDDNPDIRALGKVLETYKGILEDDNLVDFASIQTEAYRLMKENPKILKEIQNKLKYIMIDEYQDTNYIQEQIVFLLAGEKQNICVVGDDDQGLYRFRGATIRNILEFPSKFPKGMCKIIQLVVNYRSNSDIVDFYNKWMETTDGSRFKFNWGKYRYQKKIEPHTQTDIDSSAVVKLSSKDDEDEWHKKIFKFIIDLKKSGRLTNYNQIAFLFQSVKSERVNKLALFLEKNGINVYSPRSDMFFDRYEIKIALGTMMYLFPQYVQGLENNEYRFLQAEHIDYYKKCITLASEFLTKPENYEFMKWVRNHGHTHMALKGTTDYTYSGLLYQMFEYAPFKHILGADMSSGVVDVRPIRNLALLSQVIGKYEYLHRIDVLNGRTINNTTERFFNMYMKLLYDEGINEYEDDSEYAPSGCVSFLTIHQSKGMEFPIVIVDSLSNSPRKNTRDLLIDIEEKYFKRPAYEPYDQMKFFDFWRLYYTAFSRVQDLLVLTCDEDNRTPSKYFRELYDELPSVESPEFNINDFHFKEVKAVNLKSTFSFTSHITVYETCTLQYKFYKELEFMPVRAGAMIFGMLVHETIEDVHRAAIRKEEATITKENVSKWFDSNYAAISKAEHSYLSEVQRKAALNQVLRYVERQEGNWSRIQQAEVSVSLVKPDYIIEGKIDLIRGENGTIEIVDFKSEKKPDLVKQSERLEQYRRQLHIYAHLIEERTGQKVSKMHLYYTGEENGVPTITYPYTKTAIEGTMAAFDDTVKKIMNKEYNRCADDRKVCKNCDFRFYCQKKQ
ncbi:MAG: ATP-dependent helicase [Clostridia bacterium]|nr:ATP-dependent helicase [Clostridia bacterium]